MGDYMCANVLPGVLAAMLIGNSQLHDQTPQDSLSIGRVTLTLGMSQDQAIAALMSHYKLRAFAGNAAWDVVTKTRPPIRLVGSVSFENNRVVAMSKPWGPDDPKRGAEFADT